MIKKPKIPKDCDGFELSVNDKIQTRDEETGVITDEGTITHILENCVIAYVSDMTDKLVLIKANKCNLAY